MNTLKIFYCYANKDKAHRDELDKHLNIFKQQKLITTWPDLAMKIGKEYKVSPGSYIKDAHIMLCLISSDFFSSNYCYGNEVQEALKRHKKGTVRIIPIFVRPVYWESSPLHELKMLPTNNQPVTSWSNIDEAWLNVAKGILSIVQELLITFNAKEERPGERNTIPDFQQIEQILITNEQTIQLDQNTLERHQKALEIANQALQSNPGDYYMLRQKSWALNSLGRYQEALKTVNQTLQLHPIDSFMLRQKSIAHNNLGQPLDALEAANWALHLYSNDTFMLQEKSIALNSLEYYQEALEAANWALRLDPTDRLTIDLISYSLKCLEQD